MILQYTTHTHAYSCETPAYATHTHHVGEGPALGSTCSIQVILFPLFPSFVLFCFVLFCFVLFCFVLFCFVLFCFVLFCFVLFCFVLSSNPPLDSQPPSIVRPNERLRTHGGVCAGLRTQGAVYAGLRTQGGVCARLRTQGSQVCACVVDCCACSMHEEVATKW